MQKSKEDIHQRGLTRAVFAEQGMYLTGLNGETDVVVGGKRAELLRYTAQFKLHEVSSYVTTKTRGAPRVFVVVSEELVI